MVGRLLICVGVNVQRGGAGQIRLTLSAKVAMAVVTSLRWALVVVLTLYGLTAEAFQPVDVKVTFDSDSSPDFKVLLNNVEWLHSGAVSIRDSGQTWASNNKDKYILKSVDHSSESGRDIIGEFDTTT